MKNIKQIERNIKTLNLPEHEFRNRYYTEALEFAKQLAIELINSPCVNNVTWEDNLLVLAHLTEIYFEMSRKDEDFSFAEDFQREVFHESAESGDAYRKWRKELFDDDGEAAEAVEAKETAPPVEIQPNKSAAESLTGNADLAVALSNILNNPNLPVAVYNGVMEIMNDMFNELPAEHQKKLRADDESPEFIATLFDLTAETQTEKPILDLSDSSVEDLAQKLSDIMHNPNLPKKLKGCIEDELHFERVDFYTPENILTDLKTKLEESK